jgi:uncharacterized membrane protein YccC
VTARLGRGLRAADPGWIRLEQSAKLALATFSVWFVARTLLDILSDRPTLPAALFALLTCFLCFLLVVDTQPADRRWSHLLAVVPITVALLVARLLEGSDWLSGLTLLALIFLTYALRRFGVRAGEMTVLMLVTFYIATLLPLSALRLPWLLLGMVLAVLMAYLWQFLIWPYDPVRWLRRAILAYYGNAAAIVGTMIRGLEGEARDAEWEHRIGRELGRLHHCRTVIQDQFAAVTSPSEWTRQRLDDLRLQLYNVEDGLESMLGGVRQLGQGAAELPEDVRLALIRTLSALQEALASVATPERMAELATEADTLVRRARTELSSGLPPDLRLPLVQTSVGGYQIARAVARVRALDPKSGAHSAPAATTEPSRLADVQATAPSPAPQIRASVRVPLLGERRWPPLIAYGLQSALAVGVAMLVSGLLDLDYPNWVYWPVFVVMAGASGASLKRLSLRVAGAVAGATAGAILVLLVPEREWAIPVLILCQAAALFDKPVSYTRMIFWTTASMVLVLAVVGVSLVQIVVVRPFETLIGAVVAALVALYVLPIRVRDRFRLALIQYLSVIDGYVGATTARLTDPSAADDLNEHRLKVADAYALLTQALPSAVAEYNPLTQESNPLAGRTAALTAVNTNVAGLVDQVTAGGMSLTARETGLIEMLQARIHDDIGTLTAFLTGKPVQPLRSLADVAEQAGPPPAAGGDLPQEGEAPPAPGVRVIYYLRRIHRSLVEVATMIDAGTTPDATLPTAGPDTSRGSRDGASEPEVATGA